MNITLFSPSEFHHYIQQSPLSYSTYPSIVGNLTIASTKDGICKVTLEQSTAHPLYAITTINDPHFLLVGSPFQHKVWQALLQIPIGSTISYQGLAKKIGQPTASRAVANALARNPIPFFIPCHRVIRNNGIIGGYAWETAIKKTLLTAEQAFNI
jgi:O-6-methylguanine DNA methyltransferase